MSDTFKLPYVAFFGRTFEEYLEMFALDLNDLKEGNLLDCPSGPDSFVSKARELGFDVKGCDPLFEKSAEKLYELGKENLDNCFAYMESNPNLLFFNNYELFKSLKYDALNQFVADLRRKLERMYTLMQLCLNFPLQISPFIECYRPISYFAMHIFQQADFTPSKFDSGLKAFTDVLIAQRSK